MAPTSWQQPWEEPHGSFSSMLSKRDGEKPKFKEDLVVEAWGQGYLVGSFVIMACVTVANMRKGISLHKLILLELLLGVGHGLFIFFTSPVYGWVLSTTAIGLYTSWSLHNVIAWMKIKPFLGKKSSMIFIWTVIIVQPYWVLEMYSNFAYFNQINDLFLRTRPFEALFRDPWWIYTTVSLFYNIKTRYGLKITEIVQISPRFGIMLGAMILSVAFIVIDVCSVTSALKSSLPSGINPYWKLAYVFKCLTDSVVLDDFKTSLDRLRAFKYSRRGSAYGYGSRGGGINNWAGDSRDRDTWHVPSSLDQNADALDAAASLTVVDDVEETPEQIIAREQNFFDMQKAPPAEFFESRPPMWIEPAVHKSTIGLRGASEIDLMDLNDVGMAAYDSDDDYARAMREQAINDAKSMRSNSIVPQQP